MKRLKHTMLALTTAIALIMLSSCPATPQELSPSGDKPYIDPGIPQNVTVESGLQNKFILNWDPVDGADYYIIECTSASQPAEFQRIGISTMNSYEFKINSGGGSQHLDPNESYYFTVRAVTYFGTTTRESAQSLFAQGSSAPTEIEYVVYPTPTNVTISWYNPNQKDYYGDPLYNATYSVRYKIHSENEWSEPITTDEFGNPLVDYLVLGINKNDFEHETLYDFQIFAEVESIEGTTEVKSEIVTVTTSDNYNPDNIYIYDVYSDEIDGITLEWEVPKWSNATTFDARFYYFIIERTDDVDENGTVLPSAEWDVIINEFENNHSDLIQEYEKADMDTNSILAFRFKDNIDVEPGRRYVYRVTNMIIPSFADKDKVTYRADSEGIVNSEEGHMFFPFGTAATAEYTREPDHPAKSSVALSFDNPYTTAKPETLEWAVLKYVKHGDDDWSDPVIIEGQDFASAVSTEITEQRLMNGSNDCCDSRSHEYRYSLALKKVCDGSIYCEVCEFASADGSNLILTNPELISGTIESDNNLVGKIKFSWTPTEESAAAGEITYKYSVDNSSPAAVTAENNSATIDVATTDKVTVTLYASAMDGEYFSKVYNNQLRAFVFPDSFSLKASRAGHPDEIIADWDGSEAITKDIAYSLEYVLNSDSKIEQITNIQNGSLKVLRDDMPAGSELTIQIIATDSLGNTSKTESVPGSFLAIPESIRAGKGEYKDKIRISWGAVPNPDNLDIRYNIGVMNEKGGDIIDTIYAVTGTSYDYETSQTDLFFTVAAVNADNEVPTGYQNSFGTEQNQFLETEDCNFGYLLGNITEAEVKTAEIDAEGYYRPYTVITWKRVPGATDYDISVLDGTETITVSGKDHANGFSEGSSDAEKYLSYDLGSDTYTYHDNTGILRDSLDISGYTIKAKSDSDETDAYSIDDTVRRQLKEIEYINIVNSVLSHAVTEANKVISDWYPSRGFDLNPEPNRYVDGKLQIITPVSSINHGVNESSNPGWIEINGYSTDKYPGLVLTTDSSAGHVRIWTTGINGTPGSQYAGDQDLLIIGGTDDDGITRGKITISCNSTEAPKYRTAVVTLHNINIVNDSDNEFYTVQIEDNSIKTFPDSDISVKPY